MFLSVRSSFALLAACCGLAAPASAYELYREEGTELQANLTSISGIFHSRHNYDGRPGGSSWREGWVQYGLSGSTDRLGVGTLHGGFSLNSSATWGEGDPGGLTTGRERRTRIEEAYLGWRSGNAFPALGEDGIDVSAGRQVVKVGQGFLILDDGFNPGLGPANGMLNRGGAYYLAARHAFAQTAVLRLGGKEGLHGSAMYLKSDNHGQAKTSVAAGTVDYTGSLGTLGFTYIRGLDVDKRYASPMQLDRKGMNVYSVRGDGSLGVQDAQFAFEYARQNKGSGNATAWYVQAGYTFSNLPWQPAVGYTYSRYSQNWDSLFTGGLFNWLQGEVAANYAGSFANNLGVHRLSLTVQPLERVTLGARMLDFRTLNDRSTLDVSARELDLYVEWAITDNVIVSPLIGLYKPKRYAGNGGTQSDSAATNLYAQLVLVLTF